MKRRQPSQSLVRSAAIRRVVPHVNGSPRFNRQRPVGKYARRLPRPNLQRRPWFEFDSDGFFAFVLTALMLFSWTLGTAGAVAILAMSLAYMGVRLSLLGEILAPRAFILVIPAFALLSILWSQAPVDTLKYAIEFGLTAVVALLMSAAPYPKAVLWGIFLAFAIYIPAALAFGQAVDVGNNGQMAFSGLSQSKNLLGDMAATSVLVSLACFVAGIEDRRPYRALFALGVAIPEIYVLLVARSAGALLGILPAVVAFIFFMGMRSARLTMRLMVTVFVSSCAALMAFAYGSSLVTDSMSMFDKDPTLTGRTYLWQRAADLIAEKPVLGTGFNAFWVHGNPDAEGLWRYAGIAERMGFNFHNTLIELLVNIGWAGVCVVTIVAVVSTVLLLRRVMIRPSLALCFWLSILVYEFVRMPVEALGMAPFAHPTLLLFASFGVALTARRTAAARAAGRRYAHYRYRSPVMHPVFPRSALRQSRFVP